MLQLQSPKQILYREQKQSSQQENIFEGALSRYNLRQETVPTLQDI